MSGMLAYHKTSLAPTGTSHALSLHLTSSFDNPQPHWMETRQGRLISHLITARDSILQIWEVWEYGSDADGEQEEQPTARLHHLLTRRLHGTVISLARVRTLASKKDGADRVLVAFLDAKMSLMEWTPSAHDLLPVSLHTFEKLPQVAEGRTKSATDPESRLSILLLPSNTGGDATLAILPFFQEDLDLDLDLDDEDDDDDVEGEESWGEKEVNSLPYAPSHLLPLSSLTSSHTSSSLTAARSTTLPSTLPSSLPSRPTALPSSNAYSLLGSGSGPPTVRNIIDLRFLPGFNEPTLALLYSAELTWAGRTETVHDNCRVSFVALVPSSSTASSASAAAANSSSAENKNATTAILIATSPALPHSALSLHPCPPALGGVVVLTANGILHVEQAGKVVGAGTNGWFDKEWNGATSSVNDSERASGGKEKETIREPLEGAQLIFVSDDQAILYCRSGAVVQISFKVTGRTVGNIELRRIDSAVAEEGDGSIMAATASEITADATSCIERIVSNSPAHSTSSSSSSSSPSSSSSSGYIFVGSEVGSSILRRWEIVGSNALLAAEEKRKRDAEIKEEKMEMELDADLYGDDDEDADMYGTSSSKPAIKPSEDHEMEVDAIVEGNGEALPSTKSRLRGNPGEVVLVDCDAIEGYGGIRGLVSGRTGDDTQSTEVVACTGAGVSAGFTIFHRSIVPLKCRPLHPESVGEGKLLATRLLVSADLRTADDELRNVMLIADDSSTKMISSSYQPESSDPIEICLEETSFAAAAVSGCKAFLQVSATQIVIYDALLAIISSLAIESSSHVIRASIPSSPSSSIIEQHILVDFADGTNQLYSVGFKSTAVVPCLLPFQESFASMTLFIDHSRAVPVVRTKSSSPTKTPRSKRHALELVDSNDDDGMYSTEAENDASRRAGQKVSTAELIMPLLRTNRFGDDQAEGETIELPWNWLLRITAEGRLEISLVPTMELVFSASSVNLFPDVIEDGNEPIELVEGTDLDDIEIDRIMCFSLGRRKSRPHLLILLKNGSLAVYEAFTSISAPSASDRLSSLAVRFVKSLIRRLPAPLTRKKTSEANGESSAPLARREFVPFHDVGGYAGVFLTGEDPMWLVASDHGSARLFDHSEKGIYAFTRAAGEGGRFLVQSKVDLSTAALPPSICFDKEMAYTRAPRDRRYNAFTFDSDSGLYVAGALFDTVFMNYDDDGQPVFAEDSPELIKPRNYRSALELILPGSWTAIHGYEFRPNEFVSTVKTTRLNSRSTSSGMKDFISVGTTVYRAEDLAARGGIYIFEVVKVVPDAAYPSHNYQLKLLFFEDTKSVVANVCDINGYLIMSMGQKLYVRAFEEDEVLLAVAFIDVGVHVTSLQSMKNFLLIGDALQSVSLIAFQEEPYKLVVLGKDYRPNRASSANFLINDGKVAFIVSDITGVLRLYEYDPTNIASFQGQKLMLRTEYRAGNESTASMLYAKRSRNEKEDLKQNGILFGGVDGTLSTIVPVREIVFKRLQLLQTALTRHVQHFGGLNPRAYRMVKNDSVSRAITKGILDGELLAEFERLPFDQQMEITNSIKTDPDTVLLNLRDLSAW